MADETQYDRYRCEVASESGAVVERNVVRFLIATILIFSAVFIWLTLTSNSHVASFVIRGLGQRESVRVLADGKAIQTYRQQKTASRDVVFRHIGGDGRTVCFTQPVNSYRSLLAPELFHTVKGGWIFDSTTKRWCAGEVGSELVLSSVFSVIEVAVEFGEQGGKLEIQNGHEVQSFDLGVSAGKHLQQVYLRSPLTLVYAYFPLSTTSLRLELFQQEDGKMNGVGAEDLSKQSRDVLVESATLYSRFRLLEQKRERVRADAFILQVPDTVREGGEVLAILRSGASVWGRLGLVCLVFFVVGLVFVVPLSGVLTPLEGLLLAIGLGYSFLVLLSNTWSLLGLNYRQSFGLTALIGFVFSKALAHGLSCGSLRRSFTAYLAARSSGLLNLVKSGRREILPLVALSLLTASAFFMPIFFREGYYFGEGFADTWWYINLAEILKSVSPRVHMSDIWSHQRIADLTSLSLFSVLTFQSPLFAYGQHLLLFWFLCPLFSYAIANRLFATRSVDKPVVSGQVDTTAVSAICGGFKIQPLLAFVFTGCSAFLYAIVAESYMAHFLFLFVNLVAILLSLIVLRVFSASYAKDCNTEDGIPVSSRGKWGLQGVAIIVATGLVYAHAVSLYPYHFFLPIALLAGFLALWRRSKCSWRVFAPYVCIGVMAVLLANINLCLVFNVTANSTYFDNLNQIARYIVFPFYDSIEFANIFFGLSNFQLHFRFMEQLLGELYLENGILIDIISIVGGWSYSRMLVEILCPVVSFVYLLGTICLLRRIRSPYHIVLLVLLCCYTAVAAWQYKSDQVYGFGKMVMTVGSLTPLVMAISLGHPSFWSVRRILATVTGGLVALLVLLVVFCNFAAIYPSVMVQRVNHSSGVLREARSHVSAVTADTREIARLLGGMSAESKGAVLIYGYPEELVGSDKDRVFFWSLWSLLEGRRLASNARLPLGFLGTNYRALLPDSELLEQIREGNVDAVIAFRPLPPAMRRELDIEVQSSLYGVYTLRDGEVAAVSAED